MLGSEGPEIEVAPMTGPLRHIACGGGLTLAMRDIGGVLVVGLYGPVGPASDIGMQSALHTVFTSKPTRIVIDASCVTDCDRRGLGAFVDAAERARDSGIPFALSGLARRHVHLLQILWRPGVTEPLSYRDLDPALSAVISQLSRNDRTREELLVDVDELHQALIDSRVVEQATGILMAVYGFTAEAAMALLQGHAHAQDETTAALAARLVASVQRGDSGRTPSMQIDGLLDEIVGGRKSAADPHPAQPQVSVRAVAPAKASVIH